MTKKRVTITIFIVALLILLLFALFMNSSTFRGSNEASSRSYTSFTASVQTLIKTVEQVIEAPSDEKAVSMFDTYTYMLFMNQRLDLLMEHVDSIQRATTLKNDLFLLSNLYQSQVRNQISKQEELNVDAHLRLKEQLELFSAKLPDQYDGSEAFIKQFSKAVTHIRPLINGGI